MHADNLPPERTAHAHALASGADLLLAVGTSLTVYSAYRLVVAAKAAGARLALINVGETRADALADVRLDARAGEVLMRLAAHPALLLPRA